MIYKDYLQTSHWKEFKYKIYNKTKRGKKCRICSSILNLNIHHKTYYKQGKSVLFNEKLGTIMVLCQECHFLWHSLVPKHKIKSKYADRIRNLLNLGYSKKEAISNCYEKKYQKLINNPTGGILGVGTQKSLVA